ncbi:MAG: AI-2E family transporter [Planctomycetia bacterium]|nr:AI-2E family transporter [Planctomycetia bacterium]
MTDAAAAIEDVREAIDWQSVTLRLIAVLILAGACWVLATILVPFALALMVAIALSPVADRLERGGFPRALSSLACTLLVAALIAMAVGLILYQAGTIVQNSDKYIQGFGAKIEDLVRRTHSGRAAKTLGVLSQKKAPVRGETPAQKGGPGVASKGAEGDDTVAEGKEGRTQESPSAGDPKTAHEGISRGDGEAFLRRGMSAAGGWLLTGFGGLLGLLGALVLFLAYLFYMLEGRDKWVESLSAAGRRLGLRPSPGRLEKVRTQVVRYYGCLSMIALGYAVVVSLLLWLLQVPQPILWGVLAGIMEVVPYFGPLVAGVFPTVVSLSLGSWWQPASVVLMFLTLHLVEGYLVEPKLYGKVVRLDPVTILFGAIFFGAVWGPGGLAVATPMMIVLRGLIMISPDTPALDAFAGVRAEKAAPPEAAPAGA